MYSLTSLLRRLAPPVNALAAVSLGVVSPNPHPPSLVCAMIAPAHLPVLKPQQPDAQSASLKHWPVMNCEALPLPTFAAPGIELSIVPEPVDVPVPLVPVVGVLELAAGGGAAAAAEVGWAVPPVKAFAALAFGAELPKPHPPSRS